MKILLHNCCAPCTIVPLRVLRGLDHEVTGYFYNPNIHPYREFEKRKSVLGDYARTVDLEVLWDEHYDLEGYLNCTRPWGADRCRACYRICLEATARQALAGSFQAFSTTLLYSRYQKHDWLRQAGEEIGDRMGVSFFLP